MSYILNIETSTTNCSVALSKNGDLVELKEDNNKFYSHAERLHVYINDVLQAAKIDRSQIDAVAVSKGPGSYTGLRIGVSAVKGLCFALEVPMIAIPTLEILASKLNVDQGIIIPLIDARRMEVYTATFDSNMSVIEPTSAKILDSTSFIDFLNKQKVFFIGDAVEKTQGVVKHPNAYFKEAYPSSEQMCKLSFDMFKAGNFEDLAYFEPYYLKDFIVNPPKKL